MIYTSYARLAIIVALLSASAATPVAQDQTSVHLEKRTPQSDIEDAKMFLPGSSAGGLHGTSPKGAISKSQSKSSCRGSKCKLPRMILDEFLRRDMDLKFINTDGELEGAFSNYARVVPYAYKDYLIIIKQMEISNKKRKAEEKKAAAANKKKETAKEKKDAAVNKKKELAERKETAAKEKETAAADKKKKLADQKIMKEVRKKVNAAKNIQAKNDPRELLSDDQALKEWKEATNKLGDELKNSLLASKDRLEDAFGVSSEADVTGSSQVPQTQSMQLFISGFGVVSPIKEDGSRENPTSDGEYLKLLSELSTKERSAWGLKSKSMLARMI
ncbi:hypothetical protein BASA50_007146 [Batrachochytrium salamandrivorans]|uniref:Uncharacterized protein n=1 Tax=Batrachochytrium salamandrivorans TaxID=1357716 RepID=A0ABQ8F898_9FUNG|nr:hypothetical protein BASA60_003815 [Batrachochytrium salamandrivorans]KAH6593710.1 hypothetical protein BASA50_007146 [Batrachochytrium salamandrivorans]KAJ1341740.1 hypothetical protein BSLG_003700 [Batrachochytrium salamandrivorans]